jgi:hypothetical protein
MACILQPSCLGAKLFNPLTGNYESVLDLIGFGASEVRMIKAVLACDWCNVNK